MKVSSLVLRGAKGQMGGIVAGGGVDDVVYLRASPKKGNQGKDTAHLPAQSRARVAGKIAKKGKSVFKTTFPEVKRPLSAVNRFQQINMSAATAAISLDGAINFDNLVLSDGSLGKGGLAVTSAAPNTGTATNIDIELSHNNNANGANVKLYVVVMGRDDYEMKVVDTTKAQNSAASVFTVDTLGFENPVIFACWVNPATKEASTSLKIYQA